jgi:NADH-quinone oxidoreductase subunit N
MRSFFEEIILKLSSLVFNALWIDKSMLIFELIISFFLLVILLFSLFKHNYINKYSLTILNCIIILALLSMLIQDAIYFNSFNRQNAYSALLGLNVEKNYNYVLALLNAYTNIKLHYNYYFVHTVSFYNHNFIFNLFLFYVKNFNILVFLFCLIVGYSQRKIIKISYDKFMLILFPLLFCNTVLILTQDLIIGYLAIEFQNLCLIYLMSLKKKESFTLQLSVRFFILNSIGSLFILLGIVLLYTIFYTTNMSYIYILLSTLPKKIIYIYLLEIILALTFLVIGLFFKLLVGPFGLWLVEIYEYGLTYGVLIFSILPKIGYFMFLLNIFLCTSNLIFFWDFMFKFFGIISIFIGTFGALSQIYVKRLLAFSSLNYFGYILLSFIGFNTKSFIVCILYFVIYVFISFYIWFIILYLEKVTKRNILLVDLVILRDHYPILALILSLSLFFLAGLPPFFLFVLKFTTFYIFISSKTNFLILLFFLVCNFISIYYYLKLIKIIHFNPSSSEEYKIYSLSSFSLFLIVAYVILILSPYFYIIAKNIYYFFIIILNGYLSKIISKKSLVKVLLKNANLSSIYLRKKITFKFYAFEKILGKTYKVLSIGKNLPSVYSKYYKFYKKFNQKFSLISISNFFFYLRKNYELRIKSKKKINNLLNKYLFMRFVVGPKNKFILSQNFLNILLNKVYYNFSIIKKLNKVTFSDASNNFNVIYNKLKYEILIKNYLTLWYKTVHVTLKPLKYSEDFIDRFNKKFKNIALYKTFFRTPVLQFYYINVVVKVKHKYNIPLTKKEKFYICLQNYDLRTPFTNVTKFDEIFIKFILFGKTKYEYNVYGEFDKQFNKMYEELKKKNKISFNFSLNYKKLLEYRITLLNHLKGLDK